MSNTNILNHCIILFTVSLEINFIVLHVFKSKLSVSEINNEATFRQLVFIVTVIFVKFTERLIHLHVVVKLTGNTDSASYVHVHITGPGCSKLTTSLVNVSLKFQKSKPEICQYFLLKKCEKLLQCKSSSHFFNKNYQCI